MISFNIFILKNKMKYLNLYSSTTLIGVNCLTEGYYCEASAVDFCKISPNLDPIFGQKQDWLRTVHGVHNSQGWLK